MLKSIERIKGLGVYQTYSKPAGTQDFGIKNLIYGWNYSGKTTLSRLFAQLETKSANPDLAGCEFTFGTADDSITEKNFSRCNLSVRVFNSDFVRANLHFDGGSFNPILLLGKESEEAQRKIDELNKRIKRSEEVQRKLDGKFEELKTRIAQAKTDAAKFIRQRLKVAVFNLSWPKATELNAQFREAYSAAIEALLAAVDAFNQAVRKLADEVQRKADDSRKAMTPTPLATGLEKGIKDAVEAVKDLIDAITETDKPHMDALIAATQG
ncbi:MAG: AAA family ATPase [Hydrogenophaga sp.]|nr:AAA family ATPase [Hydrogenophaga sp.]